MRLALAVALLAAGGPAPEIIEETVTYDIEGDTSSELRDELDRLGPTDDTGRHDALTKWYVRWKWDYERGPNRCALKNIRATVEVKFTFPRWVNENDDVGPRWQKYLEALRTHENGHKQLGVDAARAIVAKLKKLRAEPDCDAMDSAGNAAGEKELEAARQLERDYDKKTKHGETQGATFR